jgi:hypothetical protein
MDIGIEEKSYDFISLLSQSLKWINGAVSTTDVKQDSHLFESQVQISKSKCQMNEKA